MWWDWGQGEKTPLPITLREKEICLTNPTADFFHAYIWTKQWQGKWVYPETMEPTLSAGEQINFLWGIWQWGMQIGIWAKLGLCKKRSPAVSTLNYFFKITAEHSMIILKKSMSLVVIWCNVHNCNVINVGTPNSLKKILEKIDHLLITLNDIKWKHVKITFVLTFTKYLNFLSWRRKITYQNVSQGSSQLNWKLGDLAHTPRSPNSWPLNTSSS